MLVISISTKIAHMLPLKWLPELNIEKIFKQHLSWWPKFEIITHNGSSQGPLLICGDPENFVRGGPTLTFFACFFFFVFFF